MVRHGFTLSDVRQLYIDEFYSYFVELMAVLEAEGVVKEGTTDRVKGKSEADMLRSQLRKIGKL